MTSREFNGLFQRMADLVRSPGYTMGIQFPHFPTTQQALHTVKTTDSITLWMELPGVKATDIAIEVDGKTNRLHLKVSSKNKYFETEIETHQSIPMDADLDADVGTVLENGILGLTFPIKASAKPRKIEVKALD